MSYLQKIADKLRQRRVTFAQPRPPQLSDREEIALFFRKCLPVRFVCGTAIISAVLAVLGAIAIAVMLIRDTP